MQVYLTHLVYHLNNRLRVASIIISIIIISSSSNITLTYMLSPSATHIHRCILNVINFSWILRRLIFINKVCRTLATIEIPAVYLFCHYITYPDFITPLHLMPNRYSYSTKSLSNRYMHLTNYSINKRNDGYKHNDDQDICQGHKW